MKKKQPEQLLTPREVAEWFRVDPKTVTRWAQKGLLPVVTTLGGHRRYRLSMVAELAQERFSGDDGIAEED